MAHPEISLQKLQQEMKSESPDNTRIKASKHLVHLVETHPKTVFMLIKQTIQGDDRHETYEVRVNAVRALAAMAKFDLPEEGIQAVSSLFWTAMNDSSWMVRFEVVKNIHLLHELNPEMADQCTEKALIDKWWFVKELAQEWESSRSC